MTALRANGVSNYPDPGHHSEADFNGAGVDPNRPFIERANELCGKQIGAPAWWIGGSGGPGDVSVANTGGRATGGGPPPAGGFVVPGTIGRSRSNG